VSPTRTACERCGASLETGARYCPSCGSGVIPPGGRISDTTPLPAAQPKGSAAPTVVTPKPKGSRMMEQLREATLGEYEILAELGSGGMATVFLAHDLQLDRRVAIKLMHPALVTGEGMVERFILEARTAAGLSHPNIIPIYAVKVEEDLLFFVMKFVEGRPLDSIIAREAPLSHEMVRQIVGQVAEALGYAHKRGVIHRDIKPANIMISTEGQPVLTDFGIAKVADKHGLTMTGATIGTPTYMSPEQCNALPLTGASDQYSLGVMAYEMLTGRPPFDADSVMTIMFKHINEPARPVLQQVANCPPDLAAVIDRMLVKDPEGRYPELEEVARAIHTPTSTLENKVRTQLVQFALMGSNREVLKRVSTPRSPIPSSLIRKKTRTAHAGPADPDAPVISIGRRAAFYGGLGALVVAAAVLFATQPWKTEEVASAPPAADTSGGVSSITSDPVSQPPVVEQDSALPDTTPAVVDEQPQPETRPPRATPPAARPATQPANQVSSVNVTGLTALTVGSNSMLRAEARDRQGNPISGRVVAWSSSAPEVIAVNSTGQLTALRPGRATITVTVDGLSYSVTVTAIPAVVAENPAPAPRESAPVSPPPPAQPTEAELKGQVASTIQAYSNALEGKNLARIRQLYPGMTSQGEQQLSDAFRDMQNLQVRLTVGQVTVNQETATAGVTGSWVYNLNGRRTTIPADHTYSLERRGSGWVITAIR
jgi:serine/threonine protein kinase